MKQRRAFTLVENVLAFTILALGLVAAIAMTQSGFFLSAGTKHAVRSEQLLGQMLDLYCQDYTLYSLDQTYPLSEVAGEDEVSYARKVTFSTYSSEPVAPVRQVTVATAWRWKAKSYERSRTRLVCRTGR